METKKMAADKNEEYVIVVEKNGWEFTDLEIVSKYSESVEGYIKKKIKPDSFYINTEKIISFSEDDNVSEDEFYKILNVIYNEKKTKLYCYEDLDYGDMRIYYSIRLVKLY